MYRLFLIDDENGQLELMRDILLKMKSDLEVECFTSPLEALTEMKKNPAQIVFSDIRMPQIDGLSFISQIRQEYPDTIIAILSAYGDFSYAKQALAYSVIDYLVKPISRRELKDLLDKIYRRLSCQNFPFVSPEEFSHLERALVSAAYQSDPLSVASAVEAFLAETKERRPLYSRTTAARSFSHIIFALNRQLGLDIPDTIFSAIDSCCSLEELCALTQSSVETALQKRKSLTAQSTAQTAAEIARYIDEHLTEDLSLSAIAEQFHFNTSYLSNLFKRQMGIGIKEYIIQGRIERAKELLSGSDMKIRQIAAKCGYEDDSYFVQLFKRHTGLSPRQYRKK